MAPDHPLIAWLVLPLGAYLVGSIPFGYLMGRAKGLDIRRQGSGNVGATNVGRVLGARWGYLCFALDVAKGLVPVLLVGLILRSAPAGVPAAARPAGAPGAGADAPAAAKQVAAPAAGQMEMSLQQQGAWLLAAFGAIAGHVFPVWLRFRGGKGVATSLGVLLGFYPYYTWAGLAALGIWIAAAAVWRYVSVASILAAGAFPCLFVGACYLFGWPVLNLWPLLAFAGAMALLVIFRHRTNITRLLAGTENRIGARREAGGER